MSMFDFNFIECDFYKNKEECQICLENKALYNYCDNHKFCNKCCKEWSNLNFICPLCRKLCSNNKYKKFNFELKDLNNEDISLNLLKMYFNRWHRYHCIKYKHKFVIQKVNKNYLFHCKICNIEEYFKSIKNE